jgi:hypothetical protein
MSRNALEVQKINILRRVGEDKRAYSVIQRELQMVQNMESEWSPTAYYSFYHTKVSTKYKGRTKMFPKRQGDLR